MDEGDVYELSFITYTRTNFIYSPNFSLSRSKKEEKISLFAHFSGLFLRLLPSFFGGPYFFPPFQAGFHFRKTCLLKWGELVNLELGSTMFFVS